MAGQIIGAAKSKVLMTGVLAFLCVANGTDAAKKDYSCLPPGIKNSSIVSAREEPPVKGVRQFRKITVEQELKQIRAKCTKGKLVDNTGTEIRFYKLTGCWGHPSPDDAEVLQRQRQELAALKKRYRVIEMTCNASGLNIP